MTDNYEDIINLPHPVSRTHPQMSMMARAAQFAPFAALTGYNAAIEETARLTDAERELSEVEQGALNQKMAWLQEHMSKHPLITITHFVHDTRKSGGAFVQTPGNLKSIDTVDQLLVLSDGTKVPLRGIMEVEIMDLHCKVSTYR